MILKQISDIERLYTHFEFVGRENWDDFDLVFRAIEKMQDLGYRILLHEDHIWSRVAECRKDKIPFELLYHDDFGVLLRNSEQQNNEYYIMLGIIAEEIDSMLEKS
jgi:hypothetical protein